MKLLKFSICTLWLYSVEVLNLVLSKKGDFFLKLELKLEFWMIYEKLPIDWIRKGVTFPLLSLFGSIFHENKGNKLFSGSARNWGNGVPIIGVESKNLSVVLYSFLGLRRFCFVLFYASSCISACLYCFVLHNPFTCFISCSCFVWFYKNLRDHLFNFCWISRSSKLCLSTKTAKSRGLNVKTRRGASNVFILIGNDYPR